MDDTITTVSGFEVPATISNAAKKTLKRLKKRKVVLFVHDDGPSLLVRKELEEIAGNIGLPCVNVNNYSLLLMTEKFQKKRTYNAAKDS